MKTNVTVLLIDDHTENRAEVTYALKRKGYRVLQVEHGLEALAQLKKRSVAGVLLDLSLSQGEGWKVLRAVRAQYSQCPVLVFGTTAGDAEEAVQAMKAGATDYLCKPIHLPNFYVALDQAFKGKEGEETQQDPSLQADGLLGPDSFVARSALMREVLDIVYRVAPSDANVLITGESGVGKEVVARAIHHLSPRRAHEFVPVNCATLSDEILENELFGHEKGAFTSADESKPGIFEVAHRGTLFLDEVNEMGMACQPKVLRALERLEFRRLGGIRKIKIDVRLISAANVDLEEEVHAHRFREDLFYRLKVVHIPIPPLRERQEAIVPMAEMFLQEFTEKHGRRPKVFAEEALERVRQYAWPGNVREMRNVIESLVLMTKGEKIRERDLPVNIRVAHTRTEIRLPVGLTLKEAEREILRCYLEAFPTKKEAARALNIGLRTLYAKIKEYGLASRRQEPSALRGAEMAVHEGENSH